MNMVHGDPLAHVPARPASRAQVEPQIPRQRFLAPWVSITDSLPALPFTKAGLNHPGLLFGRLSFPSSSTRLPWLAICPYRAGCHGSDCNQQSGKGNRRLALVFWFGITVHGLGVWFVEPMLFVMAFYLTACLRCGGSSSSRFRKTRRCSGVIVAAISCGSIRSHSQSLSDMARFSAFADLFLKSDEFFFAGVPGGRGWSPLSIHGISTHSSPSLRGAEGL
jgi:hypothetical protein